MTTPVVLLLVIGVIGAFDIAYFHQHQCHLLDREESRVEAWIHVARGLVYALQFALVPNVRFAGTWYVAFVALFVVDATIALADVAVEPASRRSLGGLPGGEYMMHIVLSLLVGAYLHALFVATRSWPSMPTALSLATAPAPLRLIAALMGAGCLATALREALVLLEAALPKPRPVHVAVRLRCGLRALWDLTQDHLVHPTWDHRFGRIEMLADKDKIEQGTEMIYEKRLLGVAIRGMGRYKHHRPLRQSTFEFWSGDWRSLIERGAGLWLYRGVGDGRVELATSYTYTVRWGVVGRWIDRLVFRPLIQWETERSFRRLARLYFPDGASPVVGALGRRPAPFASEEISRDGGARRRAEGPALA